MQKFVLLALFVLVFTPVVTSAAEQYPFVVTGEADFSEGDLEQSRREAREDGLKKAVLAALRAEVGQSVLDENEAGVRTKFLKNYADFIKRSGKISESQAGFRLRVVLGYELDTEKLKSRIAGAKFARGDTRSLVLVVWTQEDKDLERQELPVEGTSKAKYAAAAWMDASTQPTAVRDLANALTDNGFSLVVIESELERWITKTLGGNEVSKSFLRDLAAEAKADAVVYLRVVRRRLSTPAAANLVVERAHNVAFLLDGKSGKFIGSPIATPVIRVADGGQEVGQAWLDRVLNALIAEQARRTRLVVEGVTSIRQYDEIWSALRKLKDLEAVPRQIESKQVEFEVAVDAEAALHVVRKAFPGGKVARQAETIVLTLQPPAVAE